MWIKYATRWLPGVVAGLVGCADGARLRQHDAMALRLDLAEAAVQAFDDDHLAARALAIIQHHRELLEWPDRTRADLDRQPATRDRLEGRTPEGAR